MFMPEKVVNYFYGSFDGPALYNTALKRKN